MKIKLVFENIDMVELEVSWICMEGLDSSFHLLKDYKEGKESLLWKSCFNSCEIIIPASKLQTWTFSEQAFHEHRDSLRSHLFLHRDITSIEVENVEYFPPYKRLGPRHSMFANAYQKAIYDIDGNVRLTIKKESNIGQLLDIIQYRLYYDFHKITRRIGNRLYSLGKQRKRL